MKEGKVYCQGTTREKQPCRARVTPPQTHCFSHGGTMEPPGPVYRCGECNNRGTVCWQRVRAEGLRCRWHGGPSLAEQQSTSP